MSIMKLFRILFATLMWFPLLWTGNQAQAYAETTSSDPSAAFVVEGSELSPAQDFPLFGFPIGFEEYDFSEDVEPDDASDSEEDGVSSFAKSLCLCAHAYRLPRREATPQPARTSPTLYYITYRKLII